ncbi:hypothetical protein [Rheinheimera sp.]|uniref:hypothetical protein n=1 Tax=Rheinheimera sp. TaxID=1869214 RepID=UPI00307E1FF8
MKWLLLVTVLCWVTGCSSYNPNKTGYENLQRNHEAECRKAPPAQYQDCMRNQGMSYEEYEKLRQEALK